MTLSREARRQIAREDKPAAMITLKALQKADSAPVRFCWAKHCSMQGSHAGGSPKLRKALLQGQAESDVVPELVKGFDGDGPDRQGHQRLTRAKFDSCCDG